MFTWMKMNNKTRTIHTKLTTMIYDLSKEEIEELYNNIHNLKITTKKVCECNEETHPKQYEYCINKLGYEKPLYYIGVNYE